MFFQITLLIYKKIIENSINIKALKTFYTKWFKVSDTVILLNTYSVLKYFYF